MERFAIVSYDRTKNLHQYISTIINKGNQHLFAQGRQMKNLPHKHAVHVEHIQRALCQGVHVWRYSLTKKMQYLNCLVHKTGDVKLIMDLDATLVIRSR